MRHLVIGSMAILLACCCARPSAATVVGLSLYPVVDQSADDSNHDNVFDSWEPLSDLLLAYNALPSGYNIRAAMEFDLGSIPHGSVINSATLSLHYEGGNGDHTNTVQFNAYAGDGALGFADFQRRSADRPTVQCDGRPL